MSNPADRWSNLILKAVGLLIAGIAGGVVMVLVVIGSILAIVAIFDPTGQGPRTDPMAGLTTFFYLVGGSFAIGALLAMTAIVAFRRRRKG